MELEIRLLPAGSQMIVLGGVELDLRMKKQTGRVFLRRISNRGDSTVRHAILNCIAPGRKVWTDDHPSYQWLRCGSYFRMQWSTIRVAR